MLQHPQTLVNHSLRTIMTSNKIYCSCIACRAEITANNLKTHFLSKTCQRSETNKPKLEACPFCNRSVEILGNIGCHVQWCLDNPNRDASRLVKARSAITKESREIAAKKVEVAHSEGKYKNAATKGLATKDQNGTRLSKEKNPEWYANVSAAARSSTHQRKCKNTQVCRQARKRVYVRLIMGRCLS